MPAAGSYKILVTACQTAWSYSSKSHNIMQSILVSRFSNFCCGNSGISACIHIFGSMKVNKKYEEYLLLGYDAV
jgi:hypothetical protein